MKKLLALLLLTVPAYAQDVPLHSVPIGQGPGVVGWHSVGPCGAGQGVGWVSSSVDPTCQNLGGGGGALVIGSTTVTGGTLGNILSVSSGPTLNQTAVTGSGSVVEAVGPTVSSATLSGTFNGVVTATSPGVIIQGASSGSTTLSASAAASGVVTLPAVTDTVAVLGTANQLVSGGANYTSQNLGNINSATTVACGTRAYQYFVNTGAFTLSPPANDGSCDLLDTNSATAGTITFAAGFTVSSNTGDAITNTNTSKFIIHIERINGISTYWVKALQ